MAGPSDASGLRDAITASAERLGISPSDLGTAISYETGGKMSPSIYGGKDGRYLGLIQFSPENQKKYGVHERQTAPEQMQAVEAYLRDRGVQPGMGLLDVYSTINAGRPGLYDRSDANNGGAPGTVADKVATMAGHRMRANAMLGLDDGHAATVAPSLTGGGPAAPGAPFSLAPTGADVGDDTLTPILAALGAIPKGVAQPEDQFAAVPAIHMPSAPRPPGLEQNQRVLPSALARVRALTAAMANMR